MVGTAKSAVSVRRLAFVWMRSRMPEIKAPAKTRKIAPPMSQPRRDRRFVAALPGDCAACMEICPAVCDCIGITLELPFSQSLWLSTGLRRPMAQSMQNAEHGWNEEQRGHRGEEQSTNYGAAKGSILLATISQPQRHRQHADNHGQPSH